MVRTLRKALYGLAKGVPWGARVGQSVKPVGEPDAVNPHVRFDEGEVEPEQGAAREAPADERAGKQLGPT